MFKNSIFKSLFVVSMFIAMIASAEDKKGGKEAPQMTPEQVAAMAAWEAAAKPGADHDWLNQWVGNWTVNTKAWWNGPEATPTESKSTSKYEMELGGRYLKNTVKGEMMGMSFEGIGTLGYDNVKKEYQMTWMDNMGTGTYTAKGNRSGNTLTVEGTMDDPATGKKDVPHTYKWELKDANNATFEIWSNGTLMMKDEMTRAAK